MGEQESLDWHIDGSVISFNVLLNEDFTGGGTSIKHTSEFGIEEKSYCSKKGDLFIHPGRLKHCGNNIKSGVRYIIVGFIEYCFQLEDIINKI
jgi:hypothetical protein